MLKVEDFERTVVESSVDVRFVFDRSNGTISSAWVNFGNLENARPIKYGSRERKRLQNDIDVHGYHGYSWKERFHRDADGRHRRTG
jgi:hypothetical protein